MKTRKEKNTIKENVNNKAEELKETDLNCVTGGGDKFENVKAKERETFKAKENNDR